MKKFQGIIKKWHKDFSFYTNNESGMFRIIGECSYHNSRPEFVSQEIHTSRVVKLEEFTEGSFLCETRNSFYILLDEDKTSK